MDSDGPRNALTSLKSFERGESWSLIQTIVKPKFFTNRHRSFLWLGDVAWSCMELHGAAWKSSKSWVNRCPYWALTQMRKAGFCLRSLCHMQLCWLMEVCSSMISMHLDADVLAPDLWWCFILDLCVAHADWYRDSLQGTRWTERGGSEGAPNQLEWPQAALGALKTHI